MYTIFCSRRRHHSLAASSLVKNVCMVCMESDCQKHTISISKTIEQLSISPCVYSIHSTVLSCCVLCCQRGRTQKIRSSSVVVVVVVSLRLQHTHRCFFSEHFNGELIEDRGFLVWITEDCF